MKEALVHPRHPERICWGCSRYCPADDLCCREDRVAHPVEFYGPDWVRLEQVGVLETSDTSEAELLAK